MPMELIKNENNYNVVRWHPLVYGKYFTIGRLADGWTVVQWEWTGSEIDLKNFNDGAICHSYAQAEKLISNISDFVKDNNYIRRDRLNVELVKPEPVKKKVEVSRQKKVSKLDDNEIKNTDRFARQMYLKKEDHAMLAKLSNDRNVSQTKIVDEALSKYFNKVV